MMSTTNFPLPFPISSSTSKSLHLSLSKYFLPKFLELKNSNSAIRVSINPPPPDFDFRKEIMGSSRAAIAKTHPQLLDLADIGCLVLIQKAQYGPVPSWRAEFVEPEEIWLVGTTHISEESGGHVERVIRELRPDNVVVELCRSRAGIMYTSSDVELNQKMNSSMFALSGNGFFGAVGRSIGLGGQTALALRLLLAAFSSKLSSGVNRSFGDEFRVARKASEEVGAQIVLGDRPIEITLERAWNSLEWKDKLSLVTSVIRGIASPSTLSKNNLQHESDDSADKLELYDQLSLSYPSLLQSLIHERDTYLAWSLKRSKAVNNSNKVVGIIGKGHMNGVIYSLISDLGDLRFRDLAGKKPSTDGSAWVLDAFKTLLRDTVIGVLLWLLYENVKAGF